MFLTENKKSSFENKIYFKDSMNFEGHTNSPVYNIRFGPYHCLFFPYISCTAAADFIGNLCYMILLDELNKTETKVNTHWSPSQLWTNRIGHSNSWKTVRNLTLCRPFFCQFLEKNLFNFYSSRDYYRIQLELSLFLKYIIEQDTL